jgi:hypothetical protein
MLSMLNETRTDKELDKPLIRERIVSLTSNDQVVEQLYFKELVTFFYFPREINVSLAWSKIASGVIVGIM